MFVLAENYVAEKFFQYCGKPSFNKSAHTYQGSCPVCREGESWLKKRRCFYIPKDNLFCCHNCQEKWNPVKWIQEVSGMTFNEIKQECFDTGNSSLNVKRLSNIFEKDDELEELFREPLPKNCINLFDEQQVEYWNEHTIVKKALNLISRRKLDVAINRPKALYLSLTDFVHKNRLVFPFYDRFETNKILFYQTRALFKKQEETTAKYISKIGGNKSVFGIDNVDNNFETLFIFEGPIDSCFIKNGVAVGGIDMTSKQSEMLSQCFPFHSRIWVLDNQHVDEASKIKTNKLIEKGEIVFIWDRNFSEFKDFNDLVIYLDRNQISSKYVIENSCTGLAAKMKLKMG